MWRPIPATSWRWRRSPKCRVWELIDLLAGLHGKRQRKLTHEVTVERPSLADRINQISEALDSAAPLFQQVYTYDGLLTQLATQ